MNVHHVPPRADRLYVLERGEIVYDGPPAAVAGHPDVLRVIGGAVPP